MNTVILYTNGFFLDSALEMANCIKTKVKLIFCIEITPFSKNATILNIESIEHCNLIERPENVLNDEELKKFKPYFEGMEEVYFIVHKNKKSFSLQTIWNSFKIASTLQKHKPDLWHFDNVSLRAIGFYPLIKKLVVHLHDPVAHSGERNWRDLFKNKIYSRKANTFLFYSQFSESLFKKAFPNNKKPFAHISLQPYTFIQNLIADQNSSERSHILFFGRISHYKGIDLLMKAIPLVLKDFPETQFIIAGNPSYGCDIDPSELEKLSGNVTYIRGYLNLQDAAHLIHHSKFVVCPYREATQSGVLFTSQALGKPVVCTSVGAFTEDIIEGKNGILCDPNVESVAEGISEMLRNDKYVQLENNIDRASTAETKEKISSTLDRIYKLALK